MDHHDHVNLLRDGVPTPGGVWADLGSGTGAFTFALAQLISPAVPQSSVPQSSPEAGTLWVSGQLRGAPEIYSIDRDAGALRTQKKQMSARFPALTVHYLTADFTRPLDLPPLDGIVMANSLHFVRDRDPVLRLVRGYLKLSGRLIVVEYDTDRGNIWVPHPISYETWEPIAQRAGFTDTRLLHTRPSRFLGRIYSALSLVEQSKRPEVGEKAQDVVILEHRDAQRNTEMHRDYFTSLCVSLVFSVHLCVPISPNKTGGRI